MDFLIPNAYAQGAAGAAPGNPFISFLPLIVLFGPAVTLPDCHPEQREGSVRRPAPDEQAVGTMPPCIAPGHVIPGAALVGAQAPLALRCARRLAMPDPSLRSG